MSSQSTTALPKAVLWDLDGTLVESQPYWAASQDEIARRYGAEWSETDSLQLIGLDLLDAGAYMCERMGLTATPAQLVEEMLEGVVARIERSVPWRAGSRELLEATRASGVPCAVVTMSYRSFVEPVLADLPPDTFAVVVTGDAVSHGKPHPAPYLTAAEQLGVDPRDCVAIEDSETGMRSAIAAGCRVLVAPSHAPVTPGVAARIVPTLAGVTVADLGALME